MYGIGVISPPFMPFFNPIAQLAAAPCRSVVEVNVKSLGRTTTERITPPEMPPVFISSASAAFFRINGKGHLMHSDK